MSTRKRYNNDYKVQAVKLAMEIGQTKAAKELGLSKSAIGTLVRNARTGKLDMGNDAITFTKPLSASEKLAILERKMKALKKENRELREETYMGSTSSEASRWRYSQYNHDISNIDKDGNYPKGKEKA